MLTAAMLTAAMFTAEMFTAAEGSPGSHHVLASPARSRCRCPRQLNGHPLPLCVHAFLRRTRRRTRELVSAGRARGERWICGLTTARSVRRLTSPQRVSGRDGAERAAGRKNMETGHTPTEYPVTM